MRKPHLLVLPALVLLALPLRAANPDLSQYPLHVKVLSGSSSCTDCRSYPRPILNIIGGGDTASGGFYDNVPPTDPGYFGQGLANLVLAPGAEAIDFKYVGCKNRVTSMQPLPAKWSKKDKELEVLVAESQPGKPADPNDPHYAKCYLKVVPHDYVFVPGGGSTLHPATMSLQDYQQDTALHALIEGIRTPAAATPGTPVDAASPEELVATAQRFDATAVPIPSIPNAPFTATVISSWTSLPVRVDPHTPPGAIIDSRRVDSLGNLRTPPNTELIDEIEAGLRAKQLPHTVQPGTLKSYRLIARDSAGRIFEEYRAFIPATDAGDAPLLRLVYIDPTQHLIYRCNTSNKTCLTLPYNPRAGISYNTPSAATVVEDLGQDTFDNLNVTGSRQTTYHTRLSSPSLSDSTFPLRNEEFWYSPQLQVNLIERRTGVPYGEQTVAVEDVHLSVDPKLFQPPADYKILPMQQQPQHAAASPQLP